jgi:class 3 adenylate cyclase
MAAKVVFVPAWTYSSAACERIPALRALLADLRADYEVDVFSTPCSRRTSRPPADWGSVVLQLRQAISPGAHLLAMSSTAVAALLASAGAEPRSFAAAGISLPAATTRALGRPDMAQATLAESRFLQNANNILQQVMRGADHADLIRYAGMLDEEIDWGYLRELRLSLDEIDLVADPPRVSVPVLYLSVHSWVGRPTELAGIFSRLLPHAEIQPLSDWPFKLHEEHTGHELSAKVKAFIEGVKGSSTVSTFLVTDVVGSTKLATELGDKRWRQLIADHNSLVRRCLARFSGREVETAGDSFMATFESPSRAIQCALDAVRSTAALGLSMRAGLHTGEVDIKGEKATGLAVHVAARVAALAGAGEVLVTSTVRELLAGSPIHFADRGLHTLKGVPDQRRLFLVRDE